MAPTSPIRVIRAKAKAAGVEPAEVDSAEQNAPSAVAAAIAASRAPASEVCRPTAGRRLAISGMMDPADRSRAIGRSGIQLKPREVFRDACQPCNISER